MQTEKKKAAKKLVRLHKKAEPKLRKAFLLVSANEDAQGEPVKLLEIVEGAVEAGVMPIFFHPDHRNGIPYSSVIVELSPREFSRVNRQQIVPGEDWKIFEEILA